AEVFVVQAVCFRTPERVFRSIAALVSNDQVQVLAPTQTAVPPQASDCRQIVRFLTQVVLVKFCEWCIHYFGWPEGGQRRAAGLDHPRRLILKERLHGCHSSRLGRKSFRAKLLETLPSLPAELVIVPHGHKRKMCTRVLQLRVVQIGLIDGTIIVHRGGDVKVLYFFAARITDYVPNLPGIVCLAVFGVPNQLINEVAKVQDETQFFRLRSAFVLKNHSSVCILRTEVCVLTAYKRKTNWSRIMIVRCSACPANSTAISITVCKTIPIGPSRL